MSFYNFFSLALVITVMLTVFIETGSAMFVRPCKKCETQEECDQAPPGMCYWGENKDVCGRRVCSKGPGEKCGDKYNILGTCGEGMWCSHKDNRCYGCHIGTMTCYPD